MRKSRTLAGLFMALLVLATPHPPVSAQFPPLPPGPPPPPAGWALKADPLVQVRAAIPSGYSLVVVRAVNAGALSLVRTLIQTLGGTLGVALPIIDGQAATMPNVALPFLAGNSLVARVSLDRVILGSTERTGAAIGAVAARQ